MNTLADYARLSTDTMLRGIIVTIIKENPIFAVLPFIDMVGNSLLYNIESVAAAAGFYQTGEVWTENHPNWAQRSVSLTILGGDADVDNFAAQTRSNVTDIANDVITLKAKAISQKFQKEMILGGTTTTPEPNSIVGLIRHLEMCESTAAVDLDTSANSQIVDLSAAGSVNVTLTLLAIDELCDLVLGAPPDALIMSKRMRRKITSLSRASGAVISPVSVMAEIGLQVPAYNGIPIFVNDYIKDNLPDFGSNELDIASNNTQTTTRNATNDGSLIFAVRLGGDGLTGVQNGGIQTEYFERLETKDAKRTRIKWYCGQALFSTKAASVLIGAKDGTL